MGLKNTMTACKFKSGWKWPLVLLAACALPVGWGGQFRQDLTPPMPRLRFAHGQS